jgi:hypothetical protein
MTVGYSDKSGMVVLSAMGSTSIAGMDTGVESGPAFRTAAVV